VSAKPGQPLVEFPAEIEHGASVLRQNLLLPRVLCGTQHGHQRGRRRDVYPFGDRVLEQRRVSLQGGRQERLTRDEQDHELRRFRQGVPVGLGPQLIDVSAQVPRVRVEP
jgi:hypothetical protein